MVVLLCVAALVAFAANSIFTRAALAGTSIDAVSFTAVRLVSGALVLWLIVLLRAAGAEGRGSWASALALFGYAIAFSLAYRSLTAATGALLLFGAVQVTMISWGLVRGERLSAVQWAGILLAVAGLVGLLLPGLSPPPIGAAGLMLAAGFSWGVYTLRAKGAGDPTRVTAANFGRAALPGVAVALAFGGNLSWDGLGLALAVASGALASGMGYAIWYAALKQIGTHTAAVSQLSVPVMTAIAGVVLLAEPLDWPTVIGGACILGGIALVTRSYRMRRSD
ncbi:MAG: EamA family transporter [Gammaproteobacteria bacterium]|jgi:drug/metabolite transporter (DMT)-like permease|nr:EamA family transporter [Gammaproteobacteria bacterium]